MSAISTFTAISTVFEASGRFDFTRHMYPVDLSIMSGLCLRELLPTAILEPQLQSTCFQEAFETQTLVEQEEEGKRELLRTKYAYMMECMNYSFRHSEEFAHLTNLDAMFLFREVISQMSSYYLDQRFLIGGQLRYLNHSQDPSDQDTIAELNEQLVSCTKMARIINYNRPYMVHYFTEKWMKRYPETDKEKLKIDLHLSYKGMDIMVGLSPKGDHPRRIEEMENFEIDSKQEWFVTYEEFQKDCEEFPQFAIYPGMDYY